MNELRVLIVEDNKDTAGVFKTVLELVGYKCEVVHSAREALSRLAVYAPDLILLDIRLGIEISGEDILYQIRSNQRFDKTRVVVITAYPWLAEPIADLADLILVKPVEIEQLKNLMKRLSSLDYKSKYLSFRDPITELFNEEFFLTRLQLAFDRAKRRKEFLFGVVAIEFHFEFHLDGKQEEINPDVILIILREIASRLKRFIRPTDAVARLSGWRFATLHEDLKQPEELHLIVGRLAEKLALPLVVNDRSIDIKFDLRPVLHDPQYLLPVDILNAAQQAPSES
jgi:PleD family two-component response regulator